MPELCLPKNCSSVFVSCYGLLKRKDFELFPKKNVTVGEIKFRTFGKSDRILLTEATALLRSCR